ncbi:MAG: TfoX/Sxy family protein [Candidatus Thorarchaeota archaeon]
MKWETPSKDLMDYLTAKLENVKYEKRKMFGQFALFLNGNMLTGVFESRIFLRFPQESKKEIMELHPEITHFEPRKGQIMKEYISIPPELVANDQLLAQLLDSSVAYVVGLPAKKK